VKGLDTNVLVRYLTQDNPGQSRKATEVIERALSGGDRVHVDTVVLREVVWVLRSAYGFDRATIADVLSKLIEAAQLSIDDRDHLREATTRYRGGGGDFADYVVGLRNLGAGCETTLTFDRTHRRDELFTVV
jgi:predicted nucleic-acid-binding protein